MKTFHAIFFDIDDTLIDFKKSETLSLNQCHDYFFKNHVDLQQFYTDYSRMNHSLWKLAEENKISPAIIGAERFRQISDHYGLPINAEIPSYYEEQLIQNSTWIKGAPELLTAIKEHNIKIGFVTNGFSHIQKSKYKKLNLARYSDILVISEELGFSKPHPQIFLHALKLTNTEIANTLMVGDSLSSDGEGARRLGMPFCWYNPRQVQNTRDWQPDFMISDLLSLQGINQRILDGKN